MGRVFCCHLDNADKCEAKKYFKIVPALPNQDSDVTDIDNEEDDVYEVKDEEEEEDKVFPQESFLQPPSHSMMPLTEIKQECADEYTEEFGGESNSTEGKKTGRTIVVKRVMATFVGNRLNVKTEINDADNTQSIASDVCKSTGQSMNEESDTESDKLDANNTDTAADEFTLPVPKVKYFHEEDINNETVRKSGRLRSKGFRPDFSSIEVTLSDEETETEDSDDSEAADDQDLENNVKSTSIKHEPLEEDEYVSDKDVNVPRQSCSEESRDSMVTAGNSSTINDCGSSGDNHSKKQKSSKAKDTNVEDDRQDLRDNSELSEDPDWSLDEGAESELDDDSENDDVLDEDIESDDEFMPGKKCASTKRKSTSNPYNVKKFRKTSAAWKNIKLEDYKDKYEVIEKHSVLQKDRKSNVSDNFYHCLYCDIYESVDKSNFEQHLELHVNGVLQCSTCGFEANRTFVLQKHYREEHGDRRKSNNQTTKRVCHVCGKSYLRGKFKAHLSVAHKIAGWECRFCEAKYFTRPELQSHLSEKHTADVFPCKRCKTYVAEAKGSLLTHQRYCQGSENNKQCQQCGKVFTTLQFLKRHENCVHSNVRLHPCSQCSYSGKNTKDLTRHILVHTGGHYKTTRYTRAVQKILIILLYSKWLFCIYLCAYLTLRLKETFIYNTYVVLSTLL